MMMSVLLKLAYSFNAILVKILEVFFVDISDKLILNFIWKGKGITNNLEEEEESWKNHR